MHRFARIGWAAFCVGWTAFAASAVASPSPSGPDTPRLPREKPLGVARQWAQSAGMSSAQLQVLRAKLGSADPQTRRAAVSALEHLTADSLPAIEQRLSERADGKLSAEKAKAALTAFRHAVGSTRADDDVDIAPGIVDVLAQDRSRTTVAMAETLLMLRALEAMASREAGLTMARILDLDEGAWRREMWRARRRAGQWLLPALIELRSHESRRIKRWAARGVRALGMEDPRRATTVEDHHVAAQVVRAYASPLDFQAMPVLVRLVQDDRVQVREAARWAVAQFGKNAIWQLRELYEELTGQQADHSWDHEQTARELYTVIDRERIERTSDSLAQGMQHFVAGQLDRMADAFGRVLAAHPEHPERTKMAPGYAALAQARMAAGDLEGADDALQRAMRLAARIEDRRAYEARLAVLRAERQLKAGLVDLAGFEQATQLDPTLSTARSRLDQLSGDEKARAHSRRRWAASAALVALLLLLVVLIRQPSTPDPTDGTPAGRAPGEA